MIEINLQYKPIFDKSYIDGACSIIADFMGSVRANVSEALDVGYYQAVTLYLQLLKSICEHSVKDEYYCYFDDLYSPEYIEYVRGFPNA